MPYLKQHSLCRDHLQQVGLLLLDPSGNIRRVVSAHQHPALTMCSPGSPPPLQIHSVPFYSKSVYWNSCCQTAFLKESGFYITY